VDNDAALHKAKQALRTARKRRPETEGF
jgi:hypothetical protein